MADDFWDELEPLWTHRKLGGASKLAFAWLWRRAGRRPAHIVIQPHQLGAAFGKSARAAEKWLDKLVGADLIEIVERDNVRGTVQLYVFNPSPGRAFQRADPQLPLPFPTSDLCAHKGPDLSARKGPDLCARKGPSQNPGTLENTGNQERASDLCAHKGPDLSAPKGPPSMDMEGRRCALPLSHRTVRSMDVHGTMEEQTPGQMSALSHRALERFIDRTKPEVQKRELEKEILDCVADPQFHRSIAGRAADLVIFHAVPLRDLRHILSDIRELRRARSLDNPGAFFLSKIRELANRHGKGDLFARKE